LVNRQMKFDNRFTAALLIGGLLLGLAAPAAAQNTQAQTQVQTEAQASAQSQGIVKALKSIQKQLKTSGTDFHPLKKRERLLQKLKHEARPRLQEK
jgi:CHASE1-domain containing sensor protein